MPVILNLLALLLILRFSITIPLKRYLRVDTTPDEHLRTFYTSFLKLSHDRTDPLLLSRVFQILTTLLTLIKILRLPAEAPLKLANMGIAPSPQFYEDMDILLLPLLVLYALFLHPTAFAYLVLDTMLFWRRCSISNAITCTLLYTFPEVLVVMIEEIINNMKWLLWHCERSYGRPLEDNKANLKRHKQHQDSLRG